MDRRRTVYLAGPEVFLPDAKAVGVRKKALCDRYGFAGLYPLDNEIAGEAGGAPLERRIYEANFAMIRAADFGILNLTPFRGPSADVGTVLELGLLCGLSKPAFGYTNDAEDLLCRMRRSGQASRGSAAGPWLDPEGLWIEDFGGFDNLMITVALTRQGHPVFRHAAAPQDRFRDLIAFESCLRYASEFFSTGAAVPRPDPECPIRD